MSAVQGHWREVSEQSLPAATYLNSASGTSSRVLIIVERKEDWASYFPSEDIITAQEYLEQTRDSEPGKRVQVSICAAATSISAMAITARCWPKPGGTK